MNLLIGSETVGTYIVYTSEWASHFQGGRPRMPAEEEGVHQMFRESGRRPRKSENGAHRGTQEAERTLLWKRRENGRVMLLDSLALESSKLQYIFQFPTRFVTSFPGTIDNQEASNRTFATSGCDRVNDCLTSACLSWWFWRRTGVHAKTRVVIITQAGQWIASDAFLGWRQHLKCEQHLYKRRRPALHCDDHHCQVVKSSKTAQVNRPI